MGKFPLSSYLRMLHNTTFDFFFPELPCCKTQKKILSMFGHAKFFIQCILTNNFPKLTEYFQNKKSWIGFWLTCHCHPFLNLFLWTKCENFNMWERRNARSNFAKAAEQKPAPFSRVLIKSRSRGLIPLQGYLLY